MSQTKKPLIITVSVIIITIAAVLFFHFNPASNGTQSFNRNRSGSGTVFTVQTEVAKKSTLHDYIVTNGEIEAQNSVAVYPDIGGKIVGTNVMLGDKVKRGETIAQIDPSEPGARYALSPVVATISGTIISTPLKGGTTVTTNSTITTIGDINDLQITAYIPERYIALLQIGLKANIVLQAYPNVIFKASVTRISPVVDASSRTKEIILKFDNYDNRINAGMFATVTLFTQDFSGAVTVTNNAITTKNEKKYVFISNGDTVEQREVVLGSAVDGITQIISGVSENEKIVIAGVQSLSNGAKISDISNPKPTTSETSKTAKPTNGSQSKANGQYSGEKK